MIYINSFIHAMLNQIVCKHRSKKRSCIIIKDIKNITNQRLIYNLSQMFSLLFELTKTLPLFGLFYVLKLLLSLRTLE